MIQCIQCKERIEHGDEYILLSGYDYCGTQCIVDHFKAEGELEEKTYDDSEHNR